MYIAHHRNPSLTVISHMWDYTMLPLTQRGQHRWTLPLL